MDLRAKYRELCFSLVPLGLFNHQRENAKSAIYKLFDGLAAEFARIHQRADDLVLEANPASTAELLQLWEETLGITPNSTDTTAKRRARVVARFLEEGGQSREYFIALAAALGFEIEIETYPAFEAGSWCWPTGRWATSSTRPTRFSEIAGESFAPR